MPLVLTSKNISGTLTLAAVIQLVGPTIVSIGAIGNVVICRGDESDAPMVGSVLNPATLRVTTTIFPNACNDTAPPAPVQSYVVQSILYDYIRNTVVFCYNKGMSNNIVQLTDYNDNNIYPIAGAAAEGSITKTMLDEGVFVGAELSDPGNIAYVGTSNIQDGAVTTAKIADLNVTTAKLATGAVTSDKIDWTTIENIDMSQYKTSAVGSAARLLLTRFGKIGFIDVAFTANSNFSGSQALFTGLPYLPLYTTELTAVVGDSDSRRAVMTEANNTGEIHINDHTSAQGKFVRVFGMVFLQ